MNNLETALTYNMSLIKWDQLKDENYLKYLEANEFINCNLGNEPTDIEVLPKDIKDIVCKKLELINQCSNMPSKIMDSVIEDNKEIESMKKAEVNKICKDNDDKTNCIEKRTNIIENEFDNKSVLSKITEELNNVKMENNNFKKIIGEIVLRLDKNDKEIIKKTECAQEFIDLKERINDIEVVLEKNGNIDYFNKRIEEFPKIIKKLSDEFEKRLNEITIQLNEKVEIHGKKMESLQRAQEVIKKQFTQLSVKLQNSMKESTSKTSMPNITIDICKSSPEFNLIKEKTSKAFVLFTYIYRVK